MTSARPGVRGVRDGHDGSPIAAVMVCQHGDCAHGSGDVVEALRPLVVRTPQAMLLRTACLHPHGACDHGDHGSQGADGCWVRMQQCTHDLRPVGASTAVRGSAAAAYRRVESWLDRA